MSSKRPIIIEQGKLKAYSESDGVLEGSRNFSFKTIKASESVTIPTCQQMVVSGDLKIEAGGVIIISAGACIANIKG